MSELSVVENRWANPQEVEKHLALITKMASEKGFSSMVTVAELPDGRIYTGASRTEDRFRVGAALIMMALELMGVRTSDTS